jgi:myo-inositol-1(or 4)-monophosphatase
MDLESLCHQVCELVSDTGHFVRESRRNFTESRENTELKGHSNFVTSIDKASEKKLVAGLSSLLPEAGFIAEEGTSDKKGERYNWIIDPIDGTTNFIHGVSPYSISVGLTRDQQLIMGVVFEIVHSELFYAWEGSPAYLNGAPVRVSQSATHSGSLVVTGFPYSDFGWLDQYLQCLKFLMMNTRGVRRLGSAAVDLCYVACGRFDAFWEYGLHPWDMAAGVFIIRQAGGIVSDFDGTNQFMESGNIVACNANYYKNFHEIVSKYFVEAHESEKNDHPE